jgi:hypothetical protein
MGLAGRRGPGRNCAPCRQASSTGAARKTGGGRRPVDGEIGQAGQQPEQARDGQGPAAAHGPAQKPEHLENHEKEGENVQLHVPGPQAREFQLRRPGARETGEAPPVWARWSVSPSSGAGAGCGAILAALAVPAAAMGGPNPYDDAQGR